MATWTLLPAGFFPKQHTWHPPCLRERIKINQFQNLNIQTRLWSFDTVLFFTILVDSRGVNLALGWAFLHSHMVHAQMLSQMIFRTKMCTLQHRTPCIHRLGDYNLNIPQEGLWHIHLFWEVKIILNLCPAVGSVLCIEQRPICFTANETRILKFILRSRSSPSYATKPRGATFIV